MHPGRLVNGDSNAQAKGKAAVLGEDVGHWAHSKEKNKAASLANAPDDKTVT